MPHGGFFAEGYKGKIGKQQGFWRMAEKPNCNFLKYEYWQHMSTLKGTGHWHRAQK